MNEKTEQVQGLKFVPMTAEHLDEVLEIERRSFATPWSSESFRRGIIDPERSISIVATVSGCVVGYGVAWVVVDEVYIANLAVHHAHRRSGIGRVLLRTLLEKGLTQGCQLATLEVRQSNRVAIELYTKFGFSAIAWRKGYYRDTGEDAVVMLKNLKQRSEVGSRHDLIPSME